MARAAGTAQTHPMLQLAGIDVRAISIGGVETCIDLPGYRVAFDIGRAPEFAVARELVCFTHAHVDHMVGVVWHCATRALRNMAPPRYVVAPENAEAFEEMFAAWRKLDRSDLEHETIVLGAGGELELRPGLFLRPFDAPHRAPCQGYALWSRKQKLREAFLGLDPAEIARRRRESASEMFEVVERAEFAFCGDTMIDVVEREEVVRTARLLVLECTFVDERVSVAQARETGHVHLREIAEHAELFQNEAVLLTHFSPRYSKAEITAAVERTLPDELKRRVTLLLEGR